MNNPVVPPKTNANWVMLLLTARSFWSMPPVEDMKSSIANAAWFAASERLSNPPRPTSPARCISRRILFTLPPPACEVAFTAAACKRAIRCRVFGSSSVPAAIASAMAFRRALKAATAGPRAAAWVLPRAPCKDSNDAS